MKITGMTDLPLALRAVGCTLIAAGFPATGTCFMTREYLGDDEDYVSGEDDDLEGDDDFIGAARKQIRRVAARKPAAAGGRVAALPRPAAAAQDVEPHRVKSYLGIGAVALTNASTAADRTFTVEPQREFTITRLIVDEVKSAAGVGGLLLVRSATVGDLPQSPSAAQPAPASMFKPEATGAEIRFQTIGKGLEFVLVVDTTVALGMGETLSVGAGAYGWMVR